MHNVASNPPSSEGDAAEEADSLLKKIAEARDQAMRMKLALTARLLDMACLDMTSTQNNRK